MNEEERIVRAQSGDAAATDALLVQYRNMVRSIARSFFITGGDTEDLIQEGMCGLFLAVQNYRPGKMSFKNFAYLCVYRRIASAVRSATRKKHIPLNDSVSLADGGMDERTFTGVTPEDVLIMNESVKELTAQMQSYLSAGEYECIRLYIEGCSLSEIAARTGHNEKSADNAVQRAKKKIKKRLKEVAR